MGTGYNDGGLVSLFDVSTSAIVLSHTVGIAPLPIWNDLGSGLNYGTSTAGSPQNPANFLDFSLSSLAIADLNTAIGNGLFSIGANKALNEIFSASSANGNQQLLLEVSPVPGPVVGGLPGLLMAIAGFIGWRRSRRVRALSAIGG